MKKKMIWLIIPVILILILLIVLPPSWGRLPEGHSLSEKTGCGISESDLPHIFDRLYRCDASRSRPGSGLGLTLAAAIVRAHGGTITAASTPGKGSVFTVTLPAIEREAAS